MIKELKKLYRKNPQLATRTAKVLGYKIIAKKDVYKTSFWMKVDLKNGKPIITPKKILQQINKTEGAEQKFKIKKIKEEKVDQKSTSIYDVYKVQFITEADPYASYDAKALLERKSANEGKKTGWEIANIKHQSLD